MLSYTMYYTKIYNFSGVIIQAMLRSRLKSGHSRIFKKIFNQYSNWCLKVDIFPISSEWYFETSSPLDHNIMVDQSIFTANLFL